MLRSIFVLRNALIRIQSSVVLISMEGRRSYVSETWPRQRSWRNASCSWMLQDCNWRNGGILWKARTIVSEAFGVLSWARSTAYELNQGLNTFSLPAIDRRYSSVSAIPLDSGASAFYHKVFSLSRSGDELSDNWVGNEQVNGWVSVHTAQNYPLKERILHVSSTPAILS